MTLLSQKPGWQPTGLPDYNYWLEHRTQRLVSLLQSEDLRKAERKLCRQDPIHLLNWHSWIYAPFNPPGQEEMLFIAYPFQEDLIRHLIAEMDKCAYEPYYRSNIVIEKARDMAASWSAAFVIVWDVFFRGGTHKVLSRKEECVDKRNDMDTIFEKMRFILRRWPTWLWAEPIGFDWDKHDLNLHLINPKGGDCRGESSNSEASRAGRRRVIWFDEFAFFPKGYDESAWRAASLSTKMRVAISTPNGPHNKFYRLVKKPRPQEDEEGQKIITLSWNKHPFKAQGMEWQDGRMVSPWYIETKRTTDAQTFAREVELDYNQSLKGHVFNTYKWEHKDDKLLFDPTKRIIRAWDPGVHFMVVWGQIDSHGRLLLLKEYYDEEAHLEKVAKNVLDISERFFPGCTFEDCGDPSGAYRKVANQTRSEYMELWLTHRINVDYYFMNRVRPQDRVDTRIQAIQNKMDKWCHALNTPMLMVNHIQCPIVDAAFGGDYRRKIDIQGNVMDKIEEVHPSEDAVDCSGYIALFKGAGMGQEPSKGKGIQQKTRDIRFGVPGRD